MRTEMMEAMSSKVDRESLDDVDKRKVDWNMLKSTVLTLTRQNIHGHVEMEAEHIKDNVMAEVKKAFNIDPNMRADMIEVCQRATTQLLGIACL